MTTDTLSKIKDAINRPNLMDLVNFGIYVGISFSIIVLYACVRFPETMNSIPKILPSGSAEIALISGLLLMSIPGVWSLRQSLRMREKVREWERQEKEHD